MPLNRLLTSLLACTALVLTACSPKSDSGSDKAAKPVASVEAIASQAKGFTVGAMMSATTAYVFFDPQCPHCGHLWQASTALQKKVRFVWIPVAWINPKSMVQAAALLTAANPLELMTQHEASLMAGTGGLDTTVSPSNETEQAIKANTKMLNSYGAESVPFIVAKNPVTGAVTQHSGALNTAELAAFLGVDATP